MTIDLNGHEITVNDNAANVIAAEVTIMDTEYSDPSFFEGRGTPTGGILKKTAGEAFVVVNNGKLTLKSGNIVSERTNALRAQNGGEIVIDGGYIKAQEIAILATGRASMVTVNGGYLETVDNFVIGGNSNASSAGTNIEINGGTYLGHVASVGYIACGIHHPQGGQLTVNGGDFQIENGVGILVRSGNVIINNVNITTTGNISGKVGDSSVLINCNDVCVDMKSACPEAESTHVEIKDGIFNAAEEVDSVVLLTDNLEADAERLIVSGGTFSKS